MWYRSAGRNDTAVIAAGYPPGSGRLVRFKEDAATERTAAADWLLLKE